MKNVSGFTLLAVALWVVGLVLVSFQALGPMGPKVGVAFAAFGLLFHVIGMEQRLFKVEKEIEALRSKEQP